MEKQIKEAMDFLNTYFVAKLIEGDYELLVVNEYEACVKVEGLIFYFWMGNGLAFFRISSGVVGSFMKLTFTDDERALLFERFDKIRTEKMAEAETLRRRADWERLKEEFGE